MRFLALLLLDIHLAFAGMHSLQYFCTVVSKVINIPEFTVVGVVDDQPIVYFDSNTNIAVPKTDWVKDKGANESQIFTGHHHNYRASLHSIIHLFNQSMSGVHTFQIMCGCELGDSRTTQGYLQYGYDGDDFISFDKNTLIWTAAYPQADIIKNKWQANRAQAEYWKTYLEYTCTESLMKYVSYGKETLERKVAPEVSLLQKDSSSPVICHATGFYPKNITMTWKKNNEDHNEDVKVSETLPNADGTFQKSISLSVKSEEWKKNPDVYRCGIQHVGAEKDIVVLLNKNNINSNSASDSIIVKCLVITAIVLAVLAVSVFAAIKRTSREVKSSNSTGYVRDNTTNTTLEISDDPLPNAQ